MQRLEIASIHTPFTFFLQELRTLNPEAAARLEAALPPDVGTVLSGCAQSLAEVLHKVSAVAAACQRCDAQAFATATKELLAALDEAERTAQTVCAAAEVPEERMTGVFKHAALALANRCAEPATPGQQ